MREALLREIQELRLLVGSARDPEGRVFAQLGDALRRAGDVDEALEVLREGVDRHPHFTPGHVALGWAAQSSGDLDGALKTFRKALALDPDNPFSLFGAGSLLAARGEESGPLLVEHALELHPEVRNWVPRVTLASGRLDALPFMTLGELAPEPFMTLAELAPEPFMTLAELAPGHDGDPLADLPFMAMGELAPEPASPVQVPVLVGDERPEPVGAVGDGWSGDAEDPEAEEEEAIPVTRTMAELFVRQGLAERAVQIYEELVAASPEDRGLAERLDELRGQSRRGGAEEDADALLAAEVPEESDDLHPALSIPEPEPLSPSPYGWAGEGDDSGEVPPPQTSAAAYFGRLLAWTPGNPAREADEASSPDPSRDSEGGER